MLSLLSSPTEPEDGRRALAELEALLLQRRDVDPAVLGPLRRVAAWVERLERDLADLETLYAITVEASTTLENELSMRYDAVTSFLASTSHELRTPLHAVIGHSELVLEELADAGNHQHDRDLTRIRDSGHHLLTLVNGILDLSKVESGRIDLSAEPTDLAAIVTELASSLSPLARSHGNELTVAIGDVGPMVGDPLRIRQCLLNLIGNALKFTRDGQVVVRVAAERDERGRWGVVTVRDTGIGMSAEQLSRVFRPYAQVHGRTEPGFGGTGLGLALTRSLCDRMGGDVRVESVPGQGSTFTIRFPETLVVTG